MYFSRQKDRREETLKVICITPGRVRQETLEWEDIKGGKPEGDRIRPIKEH